MSVWSQVVGQPEAVAELEAAVEHAARVRFSTDPADESAARGGAMTHAWLFTGPPGSGRSVAARAFAAALQCPRRGCDACQVCHTVMAGTHADVHEVATEGLSLGVKEMRGVIERAARMPTTARWQVVLIEDADRMTEQASNAVLKAVEEPNERTVFLLCAPSEHPDDVSVTIRSRCRPLRLRTPVTSAIAEVLVDARRHRRRDRELGRERVRRAHRTGPAARARRERPEPPGGRARRTALPAQPGGGLRRRGRARGGRGGRGGRADR